MDLELEISFEKKTLSGSVTLAVERISNDTKVLVSNSCPIDNQYNCLIQIYLDSWHSRFENLPRPGFELQGIAGI